MTTSVISLFGELTAAVVESPAGPVVHEVLVLVVFGLSFVLWRHLGRLQGSRRSSTKSRLEAKQESFKSEPVIISKRRTPVPEPPSPAQQSKSLALEQTMLKHLEDREFTRALNLFRNLERDGRGLVFSEELYSNFIQAAIRVGKLDVVDRMFRTVNSNGLRPSGNFWQTTLKMLSSRKHFSTCLSVYSMFGKDMDADKVSLSCLINAALELGQPEKAAMMLENYGRVELEPKDYVLFFRIYQTLNDVDSSEAVFRKLGKDTSNLMFNLMLLTCVNVKDPERAWRLLQEAHSLQGEGSTIVDVVSYNTVIKGFARESNVERCFQCLSDMVDRGVTPDHVTFGTLLDMCVSDRHVEIADEIVTLLLRSNRPLDTVVCTLFIKGLIKANCLERALDLYEEMKRRQGAHPDVITFSVLIKALVDQHDLERAFACFEDLRAAGHKPDDIIYTHLLEGCRHASQHTRGQQLFDSMLAEGVRPSEFTLVTMLKLHGRCGFHREAFDLVAGWEKQHNMKPSVIHFTCLVSGCLRTKSYEQAWEAYELMRLCRVKPDSTALSTLMPGLVAGQYWERVAELAEVATSDSSCRIPVETLNNALSQMTSCGARPALVEQLCRCMERAGVPVMRRGCATVTGRRGDGFPRARRTG